MLSNLYKQRYIVSDSANKRVINSNSIVAEKLEELAKTVSVPEGSEEAGFQEGLGAFTEALPTQEDLELQMEEANMAAQQIIEDARQQAMMIQEEAVNQAELQKQQAKEAGFEEGLSNGREQAQQELRQQELLLTEKDRQLENDYQTKLNDLEPKLVDVILKVFEKVFHVQFDDKKDILLYLIQNTILNIEGSKEFQIRVCEENYLFLESHKQEIMERVGQSITIDIISDTLLKENQCTIETDSGVFECGLGVQLENLIKALRTLSL